MLSARITAASVILLTLAFLFSVPQALWAQSVVSGRILDAQTGEPLPSATVYALKNQRGAIADLEGNFQLSLKQLPDTLRVSNLGYAPKFIFVSGESVGLTVRLESKETELETVTILPGENPAHRIIRAAIANRDRNNPSKRPQYRYRSYNKLTLAIDQERARMSSPRKQASVDSLAEKMNLFLWESVTERIHRRPDRYKETVVASRTSGLPGMALPLTPTDLQDLSVYEPTMKVMGVEFISPLHPSTIKLHRFLLTDTLFDGPDTVYTIEFSPQKKSINGLTGTMRLHTRTYAVVSLEATAPMPADMVLASERIRIRQVHRPVNDSVWFPHQLWTDFRVSLPNDRDSIPMLFLARSTIDSVDLTPMLVKRDFDQYVLEVAPDAGRIPDSTWDRLRGIALTLREQRTYEYVDSLGRTMKLYKILSQIDRLRQGYVGVGPVDLDLKRLFWYTPVDGFRLGAGFRTNEKITPYGSLAGWTGYGFGDERWKYGGALTLTPFKKANNALQVGYESELSALGDDYLGFYAARPLHERPAVNQALRSYFYEPMAYRRTSWAALFLMPAPFATLRLEARNRDWTLAPLNGEELRVEAREAVGQLRYAWRERWVKSDLGEWATGSPFPILDLRLTVGQTTDGLAYQKAEASVTQVLPLRRWGRMRVQANAGRLLGDAPFPALHYFAASGQPCGIADPLTFQTMRIVRDRPYAARDFATLFLELEYVNVRFPSAAYSPDPALRASYGWGSSAGLPRSESLPMSFQAPDRGYYEIGVAVNNILPPDWTRDFPSLRMIGVGYYIGRDGRSSHSEPWTQLFKLEYRMRF